MPAVIIGAGIGGLAAAVALRRIGIETAVLERTARIHEVGAGLSLWSNAVFRHRFIPAEISESAQDIASATRSRSSPA